MATRRGNAIAGNSLKYVFGAGRAAQTQVKKMGHRKQPSKLPTSLEELKKTGKLESTSTTKRGT